MRISLAVWTLCLAAVAGPAAADQKPAHTVVAIDGKIELQRQGSTGKSLLQVGTVLRLGDLLYPVEGAVATIACANLEVVRSGNAIAGVPCPVAKADISWDGARITAARSADQGFPSLLAPRATDILEPKPLIRWSAIAGVDTYYVMVEGRGLSWKSDPVKGTELRYPDSAPALAAETDYQVTILGGGRSSSEEGTPGAGFRIAGAPRVQEIQTLIARIEALKLAELPTRLLEAMMYSDRRFNQEAIKRLDGASLQKNPIVLMLLSELFVRMQRPEPAMDACRRAVIEAKAAGDAEATGRAEAMLGRLLLTASKPGAAQYLRDAAKTYTELGDKPVLKDLERWLRQAE